MNLLPLTLEPQTAEAVPKYVVYVTAHASPKVDWNVLTVCGPLKYPGSADATVCYVPWHARPSHAYPAVQ